MSWQTFEKRRRFWEIVFWVAVGTLNGLLETFTLIDDWQRLDQPIETWQSFVWAFSSQFMIVMTIPLIVVVDRFARLPGRKLKRNLLIHLCFSLVWSVIHVSGMVAIRKAIYVWVGQTYDFGNWLQEFIYEYRKDALNYMWILVTFYTYRAITSRLRGEAKAIEQGEDESNQPTERFLIRKIGKEFLVKTEDIAWIEAAGNYMELHAGERVYPLRETMAGLEKQLNPKKFARIHRSYMVNLDEISHIVPMDSGDHRIHLKSGKQLPFSRRYRDQVKTKLAST